MTLYEQTKAFIKEVTDNALNSAKEKGEIEFSFIPDYAVEEPREKEFGDFSVNAAMLMARAAHAAPRAIAEKIVEGIDIASIGADKIEIAGPGFINFYLDKSYLYETIREIEAEGENYGNVDIAG